MQAFKLLWNQVVNFFSELPRPILAVGISFIFLMFIVNLQIEHKAELINNKQEDKARIHELERSFVFQSEVMYKQQTKMEEMETVLLRYQSIIQDLINQLNKKQKEERGNATRSEANHEKNKGVNEI